ncbi:nitrite reductase small subunit NirD [Paenibacillus puerhi]|uniref:nitrite reductase small subunit NirD n=1 Tax=Paenibacillus puerhi TaxID=2692622 RepID=UPI001358AC1A|nr:nitrite reductase small subunit NirD [Paenibacillus puerhi]
MAEAAGFQTAAGILEFVTVGAVEDFPLRLGREVKAGGLDIAVFHTTEGKLYALENRTPHRKGGPLTEGLVSGAYVYCPLRDLKIGLADGQVQAPDTGEVKTFRVRVAEGLVQIGLPQ